MQCRAVRRKIIAHLHGKNDEKEIKNTEKIHKKMLKFNKKFFIS